MGQWNRIFNRAEVAGDTFNCRSNRDAGPSGMMMSARCNGTNQGGDDESRIACAHSVLLFSWVGLVDH